MPCTSDYPEPSDLNRRLQLTAYCYLYLDGVLRKHSPALPNYTPLSGLERKLVKKTSEDYYASEDFVPRLCGALRTLKKMEPKLFEKVVYNGRSADARRLADWWEEHEAADKERERREKASKKFEGHMRSIWAVLNKDQRKALIQALDDHDSGQTALAIFNGEE